MHTYGTVYAHGTAIKIKFAVRYREKQRLNFPILNIPLSCQPPPAGWSKNLIGEVVLRSLTAGDAIRTPAGILSRSYAHGFVGTRQRWRNCRRGVVGGRPDETQSPENECNNGNRNVNFLKRASSEQQGLA